MRRAVEPGSSQRLRRFRAAVAARPRASSSSMSAQSIRGLRRPGTGSSRVCATAVGAMPKTLWIARRAMDRLTSEMLARGGRDEVAFQRDHLRNDLRGGQEGAVRIRKDDRRVAGGGAGPSEPPAEASVGLQVTGDRVLGQRL